MKPEKIARDVVIAMLQQGYFNGICDNTSSEADRVAKSSAVRATFKELAKAVEEVQKHNF